MVKRPLKDRRPIGPFVDSDNSEEEDLSDDENALLMQAERWHNKVKEEENKRKMMRNYLRGITDDDFPESKIEKMLDKAGL